VRLFVALAPPSDVLAHADRAVAPVRERWPDVRWVPSERWHLTLAFYGEVPDEKVAGTERMIERRLAGDRSLASLELRLRGAGQFSRRAVWLGVDGEVLALRRLARAVTFERRPYRPHLTVGRLRGGSDAAGAVESLSAYEGPAWVSTTVHLVRSRLGPRPSYDDVAVFQLERRP
jgi:2'-5' RNA ligase